MTQQMHDENLEMQDGGPILPWEIISLIVDEVSSTSTLTALARTCRSLHQKCVPRLWRHIKLPEWHTHHNEDDNCGQETHTARANPWPQLLHLHQGLAVSPHLAGHVRRLEFLADPFHPDRHDVIDEVHMPDWKALKKSHPLLTSAITEKGRRLLLFDDIERHMARKPLESLYSTFLGLPMALTWPHLEHLDFTEASWYHNESDDSWSGHKRSALLEMFYYLFVNPSNSILPHWPRELIIRGRRVQHGICYVDWDLLAEMTDLLPKMESLVVVYGAFSSEWDSDQFSNPPIQTNLRRLVLDRCRFWEGYEELDDILRGIHGLASLVLLLDMPAFPDYEHPTGISVIPKELLSAMSSRSATLENLTIALRAKRDPRAASILQAGPIDDSVDLSRWKSLERLHIDHNFFSMLFGAWESTEDDPFRLPPRLIELRVTATLIGVIELGQLVDVVEDKNTRCPCLERIIVDASQKGKYTVPGWWIEAMDDACGARDVEFILLENKSGCHYLPADSDDLQPWPGRNIRKHWRSLLEM
ncbi:Hypothetical protein D9617_14g076730 [Elsinoe fawcettii]|nr:Hypothetical protein D9617_14g076730 [Elsinoe fawcettii]